MAERHSLERKFGEDGAIYAWLDDWEGRPHIKVQWRVRNKPAAQPFIVRVEYASHIFKQLAAFAEELVVRELHRPEQS